MQIPVNWPVGQTTQMTIICMKDNKTALDFTGLVASNIQVLIHPTAGGSDVTGGGMLTIVSPATLGMIQYVPAASDFATPGNFQVFVVATFLSGPTVSDPIPFNVVAR